MVCNKLANFWRCTIARFLYLESAADSSDEARSLLSSRFHVYYEYIVSVLSRNTPDTITSRPRSALLRVRVAPEQLFQNALVPRVAEVLERARRQKLDIHELCAMISSDFDASGVEVGFDMIRLRRDLCPASLHRADGVDSALLLAFTLYEEVTALIWDATSTRPCTCRRIYRNCCIRCSRCCGRHLLPSRFRSPIYRW
jgi:hypothetical protein